MAPHISVMPLLAISISSAELQKLAVVSTRCRRACVSIALRSVAIYFDLTFGKQGRSIRVMDTFVLWLALSGQAFDATTTAVKLRQGCIEGNRVLQTLHTTTGPRIALLKGGVAAGYVWSFGRAKPSKTRTTTALVMAGSGFAAGAYNLTVDCRR